jgi:aminoglycoside phosphotransferase (APT) family kinase protein
VNDAAGRAAEIVGERLGSSSPPSASPLPATGPRSVLRIDWAGGPPVVAKLYPDESGRSTLALQRTLAAQVPESGRLGIPAALFYDERSRILVQQLVPGDNVSSLLAAGDPSPMEDAGRAVAELHGFSPPDGPAAGVDECVADLMRPPPQALAADRPADAGRIAGIVDRIRAALAGADPCRAPVHRDLHPRQMIADGGRIWLVDWDLAAPGDPALDVANMLVWLETHLPEDLASRAGDRFLDGYTTVAGDDVAPRVDPWRAFTYLRLACKRHRLGECPNTRVGPMLDRAAALAW